MEITVKQEQAHKLVTILHVKGEINSTTHQQFEDKAREVYEAGARSILVDLEEVSYLSSAGIRALNQLLVMLRTDAPEESDVAMSQAVRAGTWVSPHLKLVNASKSVKEVLKIAGMDMLIDIYDDVKKAVEAF
jgi:anti-anti-sigma factor